MLGIFIVMVLGLIRHGIVPGTRLAIRFLSRAAIMCVLLRVRLRISAALVQILPLWLVEPPPPPQVISVEADRSGTVLAGTTVRWTCQAEGSGPLEYAWYLYRDGERVHVQWYRSGNTFSYKLSEPGSYHVLAFNVGVSASLSQKWRCGHTSIWRR